MSVEVKNLVKVYRGHRAVDDISFSVQPGTILGFLGPNGAGKSTTMKIITCYLPQSGGDVQVCGYDTGTHSIEVRRQTGYLPEHNPIYPDMYVREYLEFIASVHRLGKGSRKAVDTMIETTGLTGEYKKRIGELSKGYRQRVGLAQAMIHNPKVLILDEPTSGLDPNQVVEIRELIKQIGKEKTVILSTHIMQEVQAMCNRVIIISKGKIVADDTTEKLQQLGSGKRFVVEVKGETTAKNWMQVKGVTNVTHNGDGRFIIDATEDVREELFRHAVRHNLVLLSVNTEESSLEEVFRQRTQK